MRQRRDRRQAGDTIVEVMIVLAVLGMAIGISYATANRSLLNARQAQEASLATELVQAQVEGLQTLAHGGTIYTDSTFCIIDSGSGPAVHVIAANDTACNLGEANRYAITINWNGATPAAGSSTPGSDTFTVKATWDDVEGQGKDTATISYRLPQPSAESFGDDGDEAGEGDAGDGGATVPLAMTVSNKQCGVVYYNEFGGGQYHRADVAITGPANDAVKIHVITTISFFGVRTDDSYYDVTLDQDGKATQHIDLGYMYGTQSGTATATDSAGSSSNTVSVCP